MLTRVLLVGATGHLGRHFVPALRERGYDVRMMLRPEPPTSQAAGRTPLVDSLVRHGAKVVEGHLEAAASVERACADVDAVVSCVDHQPDHLKLQLVLARAAGKSGRVRRMIPSQFGIDSRTYREERVTHGDTKRQLQQEFDGCGVPITYVHVNGLTTYWAASLGQLGLKAPPRDQIDVYGDGNVKFSMVTPEDVARYTVRALFDPQTANQHTLISPPDNRLSQNELLALWEERTGRKLRRRVVSPRELDDKIAGLAVEPGRFAELSFLQLIRAAWIDGLGDGRRRPDVVDLSEFYPGIQYQRIGQYLERFAEAVA